MKKLIAIILIKVILITFTGCYNSYQLNMYEIKNESTCYNNFSYDWKIESVVLMNNSKIVFNNNKAVYLIDKNIIEGIDFNNIKHQIDCENVVYVTISNQKSVNNFLGAVVTIAVIAGIMLVPTIKWQPK
jgi:hypothetical protein